MGIQLTGARPRPPTRQLNNSGRVRELTPETLPLFKRLFEESHVACFCNYWHFEGNKNEWLEKCAFRAEENFAEQEARVRSGASASRGLLYIENDRALGWMKLVPLATIPKLRKLPVYKSIDLGNEEATYGVGCFLVHPEHRGRGLARAMLQEASSFLRRWGGDCIAGFPRRTSDRLYPEEVWQGPESLFLKGNFDILHDVAPYPVLKKTLR